LSANSIIFTARLNQRQPIGLRELP
jgi:hypothetical protein